MIFRAGRDNSREQADGLIHVRLLVEAIEQRTCLRERGPRPIGAEEGYGCRHSEQHRQTRHPSPSATRRPLERDAGTRGADARPEGDLAEIPGQILRRRVAVRGILGKTPLDNGHELDWRVAGQLGDQFRLGVDDRRHRLDRCFALERAPARDHLVDDRAQRELIRAEVDRFAGHLLRRHVPGSADDD